MASITVTDTLLSPLGEGVDDAQIRVTAEETTGSVVESSYDIYTTDSAGLYSFEVEYGTYLVEVMIEDTFIPIGSCISDENTPTPVTLTEWLNYSVEVETPTVVPDDPDWAELHSDLRDGDDTESRTSVAQISDDELLVNDTKELIQNEDLAAEMAEHTLTTQNSDAVATNQMTAYSDSVLNESTQHTIALSTRDNSFTHGAELYQASNDSLILSYSAGFESDSVSLLDGFSVEDAVAAHTRHTVIGDAELSESTTVTESSVTAAYTSSAVDTSASLASEVYDDYASQTNKVSTEDAEAYSTMTAEGDVSSIETSADAITVIGSTVSFNDALGNTVLQIDLDSADVTIAGTLSLTDTSEFVGADGYSFYLEYQYSETNSDDDDDWHSTYVDGVDIYRRWREVEIIDGEASYGDWTDGVSSMLKTVPTVILSGLPISTQLMARLLGMIHSLMVTTIVGRP